MSPHRRNDGASWCDRLGWDSVFPLPRIQGECGRYNRGWRYFSRCLSLWTPSKVANSSNARIFLRRRCLKLYSRRRAGNIATVQVINELRQSDQRSEPAFDSKELIEAAAAAFHASDSILEYQRPPRPRGIALDFLKDMTPRRSFPAVTLLLIAVNVAVFIYQITLPQHAADAFISTYAFVPRKVQLALIGHRYNLAQAFIPLFTSMFLHGGFLHILGNMWFLWILWRQC